MGSTMNRQGRGDGWTWRWGEVGRAGGLRDPRRRFQQWRGRDLARRWRGCVRGCSNSGARRGPAGGRAAQRSLVATLLRRAARPPRVLSPRLPRPPIVHLVNRIATIVHNQSSATVAGVVAPKPARLKFAWKQVSKLQPSCCE